MAQVTDNNNEQQAATGNAAVIAITPVHDHTIPNAQPIVSIRIDWLRRWGLLVLFCAIALSFNLYRLGDPSIWFDEAFSVELARQPLPLLWHIIFGPEPNMELYYLFLHYWLLLTHTFGFNPTEVVVRLPSAIFAALSTGVVFLLGRRFLNVTAAVVGTSLYLLNDLQLTYAQQTRGYSLQLLLLCLSWYAIFAALTTTSGRDRFTTSVGRRRESWKEGTHGRGEPVPIYLSMWWLCYIISTTLAVYTQLFSAFVLLAQVCTIGILFLLPNQWRTHIRQRIVAYCLSLLVIVILNIPMILVSRAGAKTDWLPTPHLPDLFNLFVVISGYNTPYSQAIIICSVLIILLISTASILHSHILRQKIDILPEKMHIYIKATASWLPLLIALLCWLAVPTIVSYEISYTSLHLFSPRYLVVIVPPLCLLIGMTVAMLRVRAIQLVIALILLALALSAVPMYYQSAQVEDWNSATHWLIQHYQSGDGIVCYDNAVEQGCQIAVQYYLDAYPSAAHFDQNSPGAFSWQKYGPQNATEGYNAAINPAILALYGAQHPRLFFVTGRIPTNADAARALVAQHWLDTHYHLLAQITTRTVNVRLYATR